MILDTKVSSQFKVMSSHIMVFIDIMDFCQYFHGFSKTIFTEFVKILGKVLIMKRESV